MIFRAVLLALTLVLASSPASTQTDPPATDGAPFNPLQLNVRMSASPLHPPAGMIKQQWSLDGYRLGHLGAQSPRAAIIEDDARQRLLILSAADDGTVLVYRVGELPVDVAKRLAPTLACGQNRQCPNRRNDPAGELGCLAVCLLEHLAE